MTTISYAILAFLSSGPRSGYDLKKLFSQSESLHWSGNNNQVYTALVQLHRDGLATRDVQQPEEGPGRKVYSITSQGEAALRDWIAAGPELPEFRSPILGQLLAADIVAVESIEGLLAAYEEQLRLKLIALEELERRGTRPSFGSERQRVLWQLINDHPAVLVRAEIDWVLKVRWALTKQAGVR